MTPVSLASGKLPSASVFLAVVPMRLPLAFVLFSLVSPPVSGQPCPSTRVAFAIPPAAFPLWEDASAKPAQFTMGQDDAVSARLRYGPPSDDYAWEFVRENSRELTPLISVQGEKTRTASRNGEDACVEHQVQLAGLTAGSSYDYQLRLVDREADPDRTVYATHLFVRVHEEVHVEVTTGPVFSWVRRTAYELASRQPSEGAAYTEIVERQEDGEAGLVAGATFRPWGYDPRGRLNLYNAHFFVGLALTEEPLTNAYAGFGWGARGFSVLGGVRAYRSSRLRDGFEAGQQNPLISTIDGAIEREWKATPFVGVQIDLSTFGRIFPSPGG